MTRVIWAENARLLREHAAAAAAVRAAVTGRLSEPDPAVLRLAALCDGTAALCPDLPNPVLEKLVREVLVERSTGGSLHAGNVQSATRSGQGPDTSRGHH